MARTLKKKTEPNLYIEGEQGKSIFFRPLEGTISEQEISELQGSIDEIWHKLSAFQDERLVVLVGALLIESKIDEMLDSIFYNYSSLKESRDFSFSIRIEIARSLGLIPAHLFNSADIIRKLRNEFVHNLKCNKFSMIEKQVLIPKMIGHITKFNKTFVDSMGNLGAFKTLVTFVFIGLFVYTKHILWMNRFLRDPDFLSILGRYVNNQQ